MLLEDTLAQYLLVRNNISRSSKDVSEERQLTWVSVGVQDLSLGAFWLCYGDTVVLLLSSSSSILCYFLLIFACRWLCSPRGDLLPCVAFFPGAIGHRAELQNGQQHRQFFSYQQSSQSLHCSCHSSRCCIRCRYADSAPVYVPFW